MPGFTFASNLPEIRSDDGGEWNFQSRPNRIGDNITFDFNEDSIVIAGLPDHPILGVKALTQTLDNEVEGVEWEGTLHDDTVTINVNSFSTSGKTLRYSARAGNDIFYVDDNIVPLLGCGQNTGVSTRGGPGKDYLILAGPFDDWDIQISHSLDGFDIRPWGSGTCAYVYARDIEIIQGDDFTWTFGDRFPVMGAPDSIDNTDSQVIRNNLGVSESSGSSSSDGGTTIVNNYITNTTSTVSNNTNNNTTTNISSSGSGDISIGDIGVVTIQPLSTTPLLFKPSKLTSLLQSLVIVKRMRRLKVLMETI